MEIPYEGGHLSALHVRAEGVQGSLRSGLKAQHLQWEHEGLKIEAFDADLAWDPRAWVERVVQQPHRGEAWRQALANLQTRFDQETEEFLGEAAQLKRRGDQPALHRQCTLFMQNHQEQLEAEFYRLASPAGRRPVFSGVD